MIKEKMTLEKFIEPLSLDDFFTNYYQKKHFVIKANENRFKHIYQWKDFNKYMNGYPRNCGDLQIINFDGEDGKWCFDKQKKNPKIPKFSKRQIYDFWKSGHSFILPLQEYQKEEMVDIISALEIYYGSGTANLYCSPCADSKSFPQHADSTENFLVHVEGKVKWTLYNEFGQPHISEKIGGGVSQSEDREYTIMNEYELEAGDLLYIPRYQYHKALSLSPRISISIHFHERKSGQPKKYGALRSPWFDWINFKT